MGMDVLGRHPVSEVGEYFRANVWLWHPLWAYVEDCYPHIAEKVPLAHSNDGDGLRSKKSSQELGRALLADVKSGKAAQYIEHRTQFIAALPDEACPSCDGKDAQCDMCAGQGKVPPLASWYDLDTESIQGFAEFLMACGGFKIY